MFSIHALNPCYIHAIWQAQTWQGYHRAAKSKYQQVTISNKMIARIIRMVQRKKIDLANDHGDKLRRHKVINLRKINDLTQSATKTLPN